MLTRLKVDGFKNLVGVDVRFGPFTCVVGPNGVGKSNLFDAIAFLSALADKTLLAAATSVRGADGRLDDVARLFHRSAAGTADEMSLEAEMIVPHLGTDDLGSEAIAACTYLRYRLRLRLRRDPGAAGPLEIVEEHLDRIPKTGARKSLGFPHSPAWRDSVLVNKRGVPFIDTHVVDVEGGTRTEVHVHADAASGKGGGRKRKLLASSLPRTVLSTANSAAEHRTMVLARQEIRGWTQFQFEPTALGSPDRFTQPPGISPTGGHLPATLYALTQAEERYEEGGGENLCQQVANRLADLFGDVRTIRVQRDDVREQFILQLTDLGGTEHAARALSDGTLRFLALAILERSPSGPAVLCLEEPENGMYPDRVPAMVRLLRDLAVDPHKAVGPDNPFRQVLVNTHGPRVLAELPEGAVVVADEQRVRTKGKVQRRLRLRGLTGTWRDAPEQGQEPVGAHGLEGYVPPEVLRAEDGPRKERRLAERLDVQQMGLFPQAMPEPA